MFSLHSFPHIITSTLEVINANVCFTFSHVPIPRLVRLISLCLRIADYFLHIYISLVSTIFLQCFPQMQWCFFFAGPNPFGVCGGGKVQHAVRLWP